MKSSWIYHTNYKSSRGQAQNHQNHDKDKADQPSPAFRDSGSRLTRGGSTACEKKATAIARTILQMTLWFC
eukprot:scaffold308952_cov59-Attheya_sp.AAC.1